MGDLIYTEHHVGKRGCTQGDAQRFILLNAHLFPESETI